MKIIQKKNKNEGLSYCVSTGIYSRTYHSLFYCVLLISAFLFAFHLKKDFRIFVLMIEIIIFYLLFQITLIAGFILGYLVRGLLHIQLINKLKKEAKEQQKVEDELDAYFDVLNNYNKELETADDKLRKLFQDSKLYGINTVYLN